MYAIIQKIYEKHNKILKEGLEKVFKGDDVSTLTGSIKEFTKSLCYQEMYIILTKLCK